MEDKNYSKGIFYILLFAAIILATVILKITSSFFIPLTLALMLSFVFYPFVKNLTKFRIPWIVGIILVVILAAAAFFIIGNLLVARTQERIDPNVGIKFKMNARKPQIIAKSSPTIKQNRNTRSPVKNEIKNFMEMYRVTSAIVFVIMNIIFLLRRSSGNAVFTFSFIPLKS